MSKPELKPCPFCGSDACVARLKATCWIVLCIGTKCDGRGSYRTTEEAAINAWNRRHNEV